MTFVSRGETWAETATLWGYRSLERTARVLPEDVGRRVSTACGRLAYRHLGGLRAAVAANQARVLGLAPTDVRVGRSTRAAFELYARYWYDTFRLRTMSHAAIAGRFVVTDLHHVDAALAHGRGCLLALAHMGNWDVAGCFLAIKGYRIAAVAEVLRPPRLFELFRRHREALGMRVVPLTDPPSVRRELTRLLAENWIVALLADRDLTGHGVEVEMFGGTRRVAAGPARLALASGAPLLACPVYTTPTGWRGRAGAPLAVPHAGDARAGVRVLSQRMATEFERAIAASPPDWHLFQPGWGDAAGESRS